MTPAELAERRRALGLSQYALAAALGVNRSTVKRWEDGAFQGEAIPPWLALALAGLEQRRQTEQRDAEPAERETERC